MILFGERCWELRVQELRDSGLRTFACSPGVRCGPRVPSEGAMEDPSEGLEGSSENFREVLTGFWAVYLKDYDSRGRGFALQPACLPACPLENAVFPEQKIRFSTKKIHCTIARMLCLKKYDVRYGNARVKKKKMHVSTRQVCF